jgi:hypothetical protein
MSDKAWKATERRIATYFGTVRNPLSGGNGRHTRSDTLHPNYFIEIKHGSGCPTTWPAILKLYQETARLAAAEWKEPVLILHRKGSRGVDNDDTYFSVPDFPSCICAPVWAFMVWRKEREARQ